MRASELRFLLDFDDWAMERVIATCAPLSAAQLATEAGPGHAAPRATLLHCITGRRAWRERLQGLPATAPPSDDGYPTLADVAALWRQERAALAAYVDGLSEADLDETFEQRRPDRLLRGPRWQFVAHLVLHDMQHRSELAQALTLLGHSPGELGLTAFIQGQLAAEQPTRR